MTATRGAMLAVAAAAPAEGRRAATHLHVGWGSCPPRRGPLPNLQKQKGSPPSRSHRPLVHLRRRPTAFTLRRLQRRAASVRAALARRVGKRHRLRCLRRAALRSEAGGAQAVGQARRQHAQLASRVWRHALARSSRGGGTCQEGGGNRRIGKMARIDDAHLRRYR